MTMVAAGGAVAKPHKPGYFCYETILSLPGFYMLRVTEVGAMLSAKSAEYYCRAGECIAKAHLTNDILTKWWCITWADHWRRLAQNVEPGAQAQTEERHPGRGFGDYAGAFNPDEIRMMRNALNDALKATQVNRARYAMGGDAQPARAALAKQIIEAAKQGERDPRRLSDIASRGLAKAQKG